MVSGAYEDQGNIDGASEDAQVQMSSPIQDRAGRTTRIGVVGEGRPVFVLHPKVKPSRGVNKVEIWGSIRAQGSGGVCHLN